MTIMVGWPTIDKSVDNFIYRTVKLFYLSNMIDLTLYCNCIFQRPAREQQFNQINLICHADSLDIESRKKYQDLGYQFDDQGDNISYLNRDLGDLTGLYWVWKNSHHDWIGTNQYRRFWDEKTIEQVGLKSNTLYVYYIDLEYNTLRQFVHHHGKVLPQLLYEAARFDNINMTKEIVMSMEYINYLYGCNMFFCERELFNRVCQPFFEIIMEIYQGSKYALPYIDLGTHSPQRGIAFLAERVLTLILKNKEYYIGNINIQPIPVRVV
jgi:hypothetical protein